MYKTIDNNEPSVIQENFILKCNAISQNQIKTEDIRKNIKKRSLRED